MAVINENLVREALRTIPSPDGGGDIVTNGHVQGIALDGGKVMIALRADPAHMKSMEALRGLVERTVSGLAGVERALVALTSEVSRSSGPQAHVPQGQTQAPEKKTGGLPGITHLVAVASGKGGVGKSTTAINLALALHGLGLSVAVLDADIYGPSMPKLFGIKGRPEASDAQGKRMRPMSRYGVEVASIGFLVEEATPVIWRGPMVMTALTQLLRDVDWKPADIMIIDMPPGTGDAQITLAQQTPLSGAVIVSTPQDLALADARKGIAMFQRVNVPVLGIVENMSYFTCTKCGERHEIFGHGGARAEAETLGVPFLGEIPLDKDLRERSDRGEPVTAILPDSNYARLYKEIARKLWGQLSAGHAKPPPRIVVEN